LAGEPYNLVLKAARALAAHAQVEAKAHIALTKNLPVASGIGGGSADAAAALRGLVRLWNLDIPPEALQAIARSLGADVPVCLLGKPARIEGFGEKLTPVADFPRLDLLLVNPGVAMSTAAVFARLGRRATLDRPAPVLSRARDALVAHLERSHNDLEEPAEAIAPEIREVIDALCSDPSNFIVRMSGSGATCFAIYDNAADASAAAAEIARTHPQWWVRTARTL
jgi:4-diphosphocytidyl-2-C-methyl-D-erythritol kinase